jgi:hypothetical protein
VCVIPGSFLDQEHVTRKKIADEFGPEGRDNPLQAHMEDHKMALESLPVSKQIQRPAVVKLSFGLGVSDPPFCFPVVAGWLDCTLTNNLSLPGGVLAS